jgi:prophage regulatory protein
MTYRPDTPLKPLPKRILRRAEVRYRTSIGDSLIDRLETRGEFPSRIVLGKRAVGWFEDEIEQWINTRERGIRIHEFAKE